MVNNNLSLQIELLALKCEGSFIEAFITFADKNNIFDYKDLYEVLSDPLKQKLENEFIEKNFLPHLKNKKKTNIFDFLKN